MTGGGTLPLRKPGMFTCLAMRWYAASRLGLSSSNSASMVSLARVGFSVSTALFTGALLATVSVRVRRAARAAALRCRASLGRAHRQVSLRQRQHAAEIPPVAITGGSGRGDRTRTCDLLLPKQAR